MKSKVLLFILLLIAVSVNAQKGFTYSNTKDARMFSDSIMVNSKHNYTFNSDDERKYGYEITYKDTESENTYLNVMFGISYIGANKDLGISGTPEYYLKYIKGNFLDLYPFWNKYIDSKESEETILNKKSTYIIENGIKYLFDKNSDNWTISITNMPK